MAEQPPQYKEKKKINETLEWPDRPGDQCETPKEKDR